MCKRFLSDILYKKFSDLNFGSDHMGLWWSLAKLLGWVGEMGRARMMLNELDTATRKILRPPST